MTFKRFKKLDDGKTLMQYKIQEGSTVVLHVDGEIIVKMPDNQNHRYAFEASEMIKDFKAWVEKRSG